MGFRKQLPRLILLLIAYQAITYFFLSELPDLNTPFLDQRSLTHTTSTEFHHARSCLLQAPRYDLRGTIPTQNLTIHQPLDYSSLCQRAGLNADSQILIVGAARVPKLALAFQQCRVQKIILYDALLPNTRIHRAKFLNEIRDAYATLDITVETVWKSQLVQTATHAIILESDTLFHLEDLYQHHLRLVSFDVSTDSIVATKTYSFPTIFIEADLDSHDSVFPFIVSALAQHESSVIVNAVMVMPSDSVVRDTKESLTRLPCASACSDASNCLETVWDDILPVSQALTQNCSFVVYQYNFLDTLDQLTPYSKFDSPVPLCRVAFVSSSAAILKRRAINNTEATTTIDGWKIVAVDTTDDELTDLEFGLLLIDPTKLFADSVTKALYVDWPPMLSSSDLKLAGFIQQTEVPANNRPTKYVKRPGTAIGRTLHLPARNARKVVLFADEERVNGRNDFDPVRYVASEGYSSTVPNAQLNFYRLYSKVVQDTKHRSPEEIDATKFRPFPYTWLEISFLVHNVNLPESKSLRCEWLEEYTFWGGNRNIEKLSLAFILAKHKVTGRIDKSMKDEPTWHAILNANGERLLSSAGTELYMRFLSKS